MPRRFVVPYPPEQSLPPSDNDAGGPQLHYLSPNGEVRGGYGCVGRVPQVSTCIVDVDCDDTTAEWMKAQPDFLFLENVDG